MVAMTLLATCCAQTNSSSSLQFICKRDSFFFSELLAWLGLTAPAYEDGPAVCAVSTSTRCGLTQPICCPAGTKCCTDSAGVAQSCTASGGSCCAEGHSCGADRACCGGGCMLKGEACCGSYRCSAGQVCWPDTGTCVPGRTSSSAVAGASPSLGAAVLVIVAFLAAAQSM